MSRVSVTIIAFNEEENLPRCLESVSWADEIVVVDNHSTDRTAEIAREFGAIVEPGRVSGFGPSKRQAVAAASGEWILSVDADEVVPSALAEEVRAIIDSNAGHCGYNLPRLTNFLGRWIYHCGWYPDLVLRLFRKDRGNFNNAPVHEQVEVDGTVGRLNNHLLHYSYPSLDVYFDKFNRYTTLAAKEEADRGRKSGVYDLTVRPFACFVKHYLIRRGFLDGLEGLMISVLSSGYVFTKYAKVRKLRSEDGNTQKDKSERSFPVEKR